MDIQLLKKVLNFKTTIAINKETGLNFSLAEDVDKIKEKIIEEECANRSLKICRDAEEQMEAILDKTVPYTDEQESLINILHERGYVCKILEPELIIKNEETVVESVIDPKSTENKTLLSEDIINEEPKLKVNKELKNLVDKIAMCPDFASLMELEEDFEQVGLEIRNTNNDKVMLCFIESNDDESEQKKLRIFEDYMLIGSQKDPNKELSDRFAECLTKFVKKSLNRVTIKPSELEEPRKSWQHTKVSPYGDAIGMVMEDRNN